MSLMKRNWRRAFGFTCALLSLSCGLRAEEKCPVEVKLLLSSRSIQAVVASFGFEKETAGRVYFFDTEALDLLKQGVIVRVRQGAGNDLTVKVRLPQGAEPVDTTQLQERFPCEIDRTGAGENTSYSVRRRYKPLQVPEKGNDILSQLSPPQQKLIQNARISIAWSRVKRIANIKSTKWEAASQSFPKLALELWEWQASNILEISAKAGPDEGQSAYSELQRLVNMKNLSLSARQGTKTRIVLETLTHSTSTLR
jgi:hypothetical protein